MIILVLFLLRRDVNSQKVCTAAMVVQVEVVVVMITVSEVALLAHADSL